MSASEFALWWQRLTSFFLSSTSSCRPTVSEFATFAMQLRNSQSGLRADGKYQCPKVQLQSPCHLNSSVALGQGETTATRVYVTFDSGPHLHWTIFSQPTPRPPGTDGIQPIKSHIRKIRWRSPNELILQVFWPMGTTHKCKPGSVWQNVRDLVKSGESIVHIVSSVENVMEEDDQHLQNEPLQATHAQVKQYLE